MARKYAKVEGLTEEIQTRKARGETNREIAASYGLSKGQVEQLINRQNRKERKEEGYIPRPKGRSRKGPVSEETKRNNEIVSCVCRWNCCEIFCAKLEGGEAEVSGD